METTILVVDDSKMQVHLLERILRDLGYTNVETAHCCDEAIKLLSAKKVDLILSDWHMPGASGLDLLKRVRSQKSTESVPFVMITSEHEKSSIFEAAKAGLQGYVLKPVNKDALKKKLYSLAKNHPSLNPPHEAM